ncbi:hypothetical protein [Pseudorhodoferax sp. Leaf274]|uniref:hypothetical protein n=1 Tax=Pseudorhodoferax sp. Leaf274 TaxID=1736318 RepID=UPI0007036FE4|nr:hypothetical protein [Pseudorhodoferax sp. Leaf274]KQP36099.1 hypothetical protein ASF44_16145 [Pseudorhodoferax sp. Leaf274]
MADKLRSIEIHFSAAVELPDGFERALDGLLHMVCEKFQRDHPDLVMWPAGSGQRPIRWDQGVPVDFDETGHYVEVYAREDLHGSNPHNPERVRLQEAVAESRRAARAARSQGGA